MTETLPPPKCKLCQQSKVLVGGVRLCMHCDTTNCTPSRCKKCKNIYEGFHKEADV